MGWPRLASTLRSGGARSSFWNGMFTDGMNAGSFRKNSISVRTMPFSGSLKKLTAPPMTSTS
jgi:hypothetical protein